MTREEQIEMIEMLKEEYEDCAGDDSYTQEWLEHWMPLPQPYKGGE